MGSRRRRPAPGSDLPRIVNYKWQIIVDLLRYGIDLLLTDVTQPREGGGDIISDVGPNLDLQVR